MPFSLAKVLKFMPCLRAMAYRVSPRRTLCVAALGELDALVESVVVRGRRVLGPLEQALSNSAQSNTAITP